jgi:uncharacterized protein YjbJ (UPF0337 family)
MNVHDRTEGAAKVAVGKVEGAIGEAMGDVEMQARGAALEIEGHVQEVAGTVEEAVIGAADQAKALVSNIGERWRRAGDSATRLRERVEERPFASLALAAAGGFVVGLLFGGRGPRVIYVKPAPPPRAPGSGRAAPGL